MAETGNPFTWLGLAPGDYAERESTGRLDDAAFADHLLCDPERQARHLRSVQDRSEGWSLDAQIEAVFSAAVTSLFEGNSAGRFEGLPLLRYSNRCRLLDLAARLGIAPFEANLLIERARFRATRGNSPPIVGTKSEGRHLPVRPTRRLTRRARLLAIVAVALAMDAAILIALAAMWG